MALEDHFQLTVLNPPARLTMGERGKFFARDVDQAGWVVVQQLHGPDRIVERGRDIVQDPIDRLKSIAVHALLPDELINNGRRNRGQPVAAECRLDVQPDVLLTHLQRVVPGIQPGAVIPDIEEISEGQRGIIVAPAVDVEIVSVNPGQLGIIVVVN